MRAQFRISDLVPAVLNVETVDDGADAIAITDLGSHRFAHALRLVLRPVVFIVAILG